MCFREGLLNQRSYKVLPRQEKVKGVHHHQTSITWNVKGSSSKRRKKKIKYRNSKMAIRIYQQLNLKYKISEQVEQKQTHRYREHFDSCQMGWRVGGMGEKGEGIKKYKLVATEQSWGWKVQHGEYSQ